MNKYVKDHHCDLDTDEEEDEDSEYGDDNSDTESDSGYENYQSELKKKKQKSRDSSRYGKEKTKTIRIILEKEDRPVKKPSQQDPMDDLVDKMSRLSIHELANAKAYFKAINLSPLVEKYFLCQ